MPTAVLFDLYNTLVDGGDRQSERLRAEMAADLNVDPQRFAALWYQSWAARSTGALGDAEATVRAVARQAGADPSAAAVRLACARRLAFQRRTLWPSPGTLAALDRIRAAGWRTAVVSNCTHETATLWKTTPLAPRFEAAALSVELGIAKPDPAIFLAACTALGVAPAECVYIGDGADNELPAAAALGMSVVQTEEFKPSTGAWPRQRVANLGEFAAALLSGQPERSPRSAPAW
jgi:putative hydrolase of the HAD superfamily